MVDDEADCCAEDDDEADGLNAAPYKPYAICDVDPALAITKV